MTGAVGDEGDAEDGLGGVAGDDEAVAVAEVSAAVAHGGDAVEGGAVGVVAE